MITRTRITNFTPGTGVTVADFKNFGRIPNIESEDGYIQSMLNSAALFIMQHTGQVFDASLDVSFNARSIDPDDFGSKMEIELPLIGEGLTITSAEKFDDSYTGTDWMYVLKGSERLVGNVEDEITIVYSISNTDLPDPIKQAILLKALELYDNRGTEEITPDIAGLVAPYRRRTFLA